MKSIAGQQDINFYINILHQLPGMIVIGDKESRCIFANKYTTRLFGYLNEDSMLGITPYDMKCNAVESASSFMSQNEFVYQTGNELTILDIHKYADGQQKILLTKKIPYHENNEIIGTICHCIEIHSATLSQTCAALINSDKKFYTKVSANERSYTLDFKIHNTQLSERELDCLFYLLRGNSMKKIGKQLDISPRTVERYLEQSKYKLNCENRADLVEKCLEKGLLNYIPSKILSHDISNILYSSDMMRQ